MSTVDTPRNSHNAHREANWQEVGFRAAGRTSQEQCPRVSGEPRRRKAATMPRDWSMGENAPRRCWLVSTLVLSLASALVACGGNPHSHDAGVVGDGATDADIESDADGDSSRPEPMGCRAVACSEDQWCWTGPLPSGNPIADAWTDEEGTVYAVGGHGTVLRYSGDALCLLPTGVTNTLSGVFGLSTTDVWVVGSEGLVLRFDGDAWSELPFSAGSINAEEVTLTDVWGTSARNVYVTSNAGVFHYDGSSWTEVADMRSRRILGFAPDDIYVHTPDLHHFDGTSWSETTFDQPLQTSVTALWGAVPGDVWVATTTWVQDRYEQALHHIKDSGVTANDLLVYREIDAIGGSGPSDVWATGIRYMYHYDGTSWHVQNGFSPDGARVLQARGPGDILALGTLSSRFDGQAWQPLSQGPYFRGETVVGIVAESADDVVVGDMDGLWRYNGATWSRSVAPTHNGELRNLVAGSDGVVALVDGSDDALFLVNGENWAELPYPTGMNAQVSLIWGESSTELIGVGPTSSFHFDGTQWSEQSFDARHNVVAVWGSAMSDVFAVVSALDGRRIVHFDGDSWETMEVPEDVLELTAIGGSGPSDVYAVGLIGPDYPGTGCVLHYDGTSWSRVSIGETPPLRTVWAGAPDNVYVGGDDGAILQFDGQAWTTMDSGTHAPIRQLRIANQDGTVVAGAGSGMLELVN